MEKTLAGVLGACKKLPIVSRAGRPPRDLKGTVPKSGVEFQFDDEIDRRKKSEVENFPKYGKLRRQKNTTLDEKQLARDEACGRFLFSGKIERIRSSVMFPRWGELDL